MKLHERTMIMQKHSADFNWVMIEFIKDRDISYTELLILLNEYARNSILKYLLRQERHPDNPNKKADEE